MTKYLIPVLAGLVISCAQSVAQSQESNEHIRKEFSVANAGASVLVIYNINGLINVEGSAGDKVSFDVEKRITADDRQELEKGKQELKLAFEQKGDTIIAYIAEPFDSRPNRNNRRNNDDQRIHYDFTLDFTVKIPRAMNVNVSTVNRGDVRVKDVAGDLRVRNVNGAIALTNARGATDVHTINGNVDANYLASPPDKSSYYTLNGNIRVSYPASLSAEMQFKTFQGEFYTDFPEAEILPVRVVKNQERKDDKTVYKLNKTTAIRVGTGGRTLRFETFNGNVYIKKQS
ncbi:DUF4097 family beta strand repeat-containing protein [Spirosoma utsteinense]|uniref:Adhesin domain-containing protein n=1 Tax=Spirosoma utsteinense TaxID=2585773 RepID=A0ABR6W5R2_9BACT|nr:hypothetical protein [Spirosoma utsteinense]MBC3788571.1 hypothetical protein [Spirosoma utsteinense]MBC3791822.1 hypothetical protein [Spirosoma utsteinense]